MEPALYVGTVLSAIVSFMSLGSGTSPLCRYCLVGDYFLLVVGSCRLVEPAFYVSTVLLAIISFSSLGLVG